MKLSNSFNEFKKTVISMLSDDEVNKNYLINQINNLPKNPVKNYHSHILDTFVHLVFSEEDAIKHWEKIFDNYHYLNLKLKRNIGLRVAMFDYFINFSQMLSNPILVEINLFQEAEKQAMVDNLTGLFNRRYMDIAFKRELKRSIRFDKVLSILMIDIDDFKNINDTKGHLFGDEVLSKFSAFLKEFSREEDTVCRYGGEEFLVILPETTTDGVLKYAERLRNKLAEFGIFKKHAITFSGGIASYPFDGDTQENLLKMADKALYAAKYSGKNCIIKSRSDNRRFNRFHKSWKLSYQLLDKSFEKTDIRELYTQDVSAGGVRFETEDQMSIDTKLLFNIELPDQNKLIIIGKVCWVKKINETIHEYGIQFCDVNADQLKKIKSLLIN